MENMEVTPRARNPVLAPGRRLFAEMRFLRISRRTMLRIARRRSSDRHLQNAKRPSLARQASKILEVTVGIEPTKYGFANRPISHSGTSPHVPDQSTDRARDWQLEHRHLSPNAWHQVDKSYTPRCSEPQICL